MIQHGLVLPKKLTLAPIARLIRVGRVLHPKLVHCFRHVRLDCKTGDQHCEHFDGHHDRLRRRGRTDRR